MDSAHEYTRAFRLPGGRWSVHYGFHLDRQAAAYRRAGYPCFYIVDETLQSVTPRNNTTADRTPELILSLLARRGAPLFGREQSRWLRKIATLAKRRGYGWFVSPYRKRARRLPENRFPDFYALVGHDRFSTGPIANQSDYLGALHEMGHLKINRPNAPGVFLEIEAAAWYFALANARERLRPQTLADLIMSYRSYLRLHRKQNRRRSMPLPVPMAARHLVAEFADCELEPARYRHRLSYLMNTPV